MTPVKETVEVSRGEIVGRIKKASGFYRVTVIKRKDGSKRTMICKNKVQKHLTGGERKYNPDFHDLIPTYSMDAKGYRAIAVEGILEAKIGGILYKVVDNS